MASDGKKSKSQAVTKNNSEMKYINLLFIRIFF
jgi:hypothetical protein